MPDAGIFELVIYLIFTTTEIRGEWKMRSWYRETRYECGDYMDVMIYPVYTKSPVRRKKAKPTSDVQQKLNEIYAEEKLIRIANANFTPRDYKVELTYSKDHLPKTDEEAERDLTNYLRRVKRYRKQHGMSELKYIAVTEKGTRSGRYHHHLIMSGDITLFDLVALWGKGIVGSDLLVFDENGIANLVKYMMKQLREFLGKKKYKRSRNMIDPPPKKRDNRFSKKSVIELAKDTENRTEYDKLYDGYHLASASASFNDVNGGVFLRMRYYKKEAAWCRQKGSNRKRYSAGLSLQKNSTPNSD